MADQNLARNIELTLTDEVSPGMEHISEEFLRLSDRISQVTDRIDQLSGRMSSAGFQDALSRNAENSDAIFAKMQERVQQLQQEQEALLQQRNELENQMRGGLTTSTSVAPVSQGNLDYYARQAEEVSSAWQKAAEAKQSAVESMERGDSELVQRSHQAYAESLADAAQFIEGGRKVAGEVESEAHAFDVETASVRELETTLRDLREINRDSQWAGGFDDQIAKIEVRLKELGATAEQTGAQLAQTGEKVAASGGGQGGGGFLGKVGNAFENTLLYGGAYQVMYGAQNVVGGALGGLVSKPAEEEQALEVYTRELGSATEAQARFNAVMADAMKTGIPEADLLKMDERLAQLGVNSDTAQQRFGRSLEQIRKDMEDLSQVPGLTSDQVTEFFTRSSEGASRLAMSLKTAGIATTGELESLGVKFNDTGTTILSTSSQTTDALLSLIEQKFGGLADAHATTMQGMEERTKATWDKIEQTVGKPIFTEVELRERKMLDSMQDPKTLTFFDQLGERLGGALTLIGMGWDLITQKIGEFWNAAGSIIQSAGGLVGLDFSKLSTEFNTVNPLADQLTNKLKEVMQEHEALSGAASNYGSNATNAFAGATDAAEINRVAIEALKQSLADASDEASRMQDSVNALKMPLQDTLANVKATEQARMAGFDDALAPLQDKLQSIRDAAQDSTAAYDKTTQGLQDKLAGVQASAQGIQEKYQGQIDALKQQEQSLDRIYQRQQELNSLASLNKKIATDQVLAVDIYSSQGRAAAERLPDEYDQRTDMYGKMAHEDQKNALEDQVASLERAQKSEEAANQAQQRALQDNIKAVERERQNTAAFYRDQENEINRNIRSIQDAKKDEQAYFKGIEDGISAQIAQIDRAYKQVELGVRGVEDAAKQRILDLQHGATQALSTTQAMSVGVLATIDQAIKKIFDTVRQLNGVSVDGNAQSSGSFGPDQGYAGGRASGGFVKPGTYVDVGENGPEQLYMGWGGGTVVSNSASGMRPSGISGMITLVGLDRLGREQFRDLVTLERGHIDKQVAISIKENR